MTNLTGIVRRSQPERGDRTALRQDDLTLSCADLRRDSGKAAAVRRDARIRPADRVAMYPRHVWLVDELPKGPTGKILRREVRPPSRDPA